MTKTFISTSKANHAVTEAKYALINKGDFKPRNVVQCLVTIANNRTQFLLCYWRIMQITIVIVVIG